MARILEKIIDDAPMTPLGVDDETARVIIEVLSVTELAFIAGGYPSYLLQYKPAYRDIDIYCTMRNQELLLETLEEKFMKPGLVKECSVWDKTTDSWYTVIFQSHTGKIVKMIVYHENNGEEEKLADFILRVVSSFDLKICRNVLVPYDSTMWKFIRLTGNVALAQQEVTKMREEGFVKWDDEIISYEKRLNFIDRLKKFRGASRPVMRLPPVSTEELLLGDNLHCDFRPMETK